MEEKEFNERMGLADALLTQVTPMRQESLNIIKSLTSDINKYMQIVSTRDTKFKEYLNYLKDFNYSDEVTTPSDLFPGIRTVADTVDPDELNQKTETMKELARVVEEYNKQAELLGPHTLQSMRKLFGLLSEVLIEENQIYDASIDILQDLDSIYDIGQIARSTK